MPIRKSTTMRTSARCAREIDYDAHVSTMCERRGCASGRTTAFKRMSEGRRARRPLGRCEQHKAGDGDGHESVPLVASSRRSSMKSVSHFTW